MHHRLLRTDVTVHSRQVLLVSPDYRDLILFRRTSIRCSILYIANVPRRLSRIAPKQRRVSFRLAAGSVDPDEQPRE